MSKVWYGSIQNRLEENRMYVDDIQIGTGVTEYSWSDRHPYEVVEVKDQKHVKVRELGHKHIGDGCMDNNWMLVSNENNPVRTLTKRGDRWYWTVEITSDILDELESEDAEKRLHASLFLCHNNVDAETLRSKKKVTRYHKASVSFGVADYYYDYEF
jgi:hypothetical protein